MRFGLIDGCPADIRLIRILEEIRAMGCPVTYQSLDRSQNAIDYARSQGSSKSSQAELYYGFTHGLPGYNPANPPGQSTHERASDGVAYPGPIGRRLAWWQTGIDCSDAATLIVWLRKLDIVATITYPGNPAEGHHINIRKAPIAGLTDRVLKRGNTGNDIKKLNGSLNWLISPNTDTRYLKGSDKGAAGNKFTKDTEHALKRFQKEHKQVGDGVYGPNTEKQLEVAIRRQKKIIERLKDQRDHLLNVGSKNSKTWTQAQWRQMVNKLRRLKTYGVRNKPVNLPNRVPAKYDRQIYEKRIKVHGLINKAKRNKRWTEKDWATAVRLLRKLEELGMRNSSPSIEQPPPPPKFKDPKPKPKPKPKQKTPKPKDDTPQVMRISMRGIDFIEEFEGLPNGGKVYNDPLGHATVGYGHLLHLGPATDADRKGIWIDDQQKPGQLLRIEARILLRQDLNNRYEPAVRKLFRKGGILHGLFTQERYDALVSFAYNMGVGSVTGKPVTGFETIGRAIEARDIEKIAASFILYRNPGTAAEQGLRRRREREAKLFLNGLYL